MSSAPSAWPVQLPAAPQAFEAVIGGAFVPAGARETLTRENPAHGVPVSLYPRATAEDVARAVGAAREAADTGVWSGMSGAARARILVNVARRIEAEIDTLRRVECLETGKPVANVEREIRGAAAHWDYAATLARHTYGDTYDQLGGGQLGLLLRQPFGVVGLITPWNYPLLIVSQKLPFALAVGCCAVVKPSELTSGTTLLLGRMLLEEGVPPGVVNVVAGHGPDVGSAICEDPRVDMVSFTGSTTVGRHIARLAGDRLKKVSLELGGKSAHIVCADADLALAAEKVVLGATRNSGQACVAGSRLIVARSIADGFVAAIREGMAKLVVGDPLDPSTQLGPLVSGAQKERVEGYVRSGREDGAAYWSRTTPLPGKGHFVQPSVFTGVRPDMAIAREEIFGPVLSVLTFDTVEEGLALANDTSYGLSAGVWTRDIDTAFRFGRGLRAGTVEVNTYMAGAPELPLVGHRDSGLGHERGRFAVDEFTEMKTMLLQLS